MGVSQSEGGVSQKSVCEPVRGGGANNSRGTPKILTTYLKCQHNKLLLLSTLSTFFTNPPDYLSFSLTWQEPHLHFHTWRISTAAIITIFYF